jgi:hypothetical protein
MRRNLIHKVGDIFLTVEVVIVGERATFDPGTQYTSWRMLAEELVKRGAAQSEIERAEREVTTRDTTAISY